MLMPGNHIPADAAPDGRRVASHADREQVIEVLKAAFVQGRLTKDEFGTRVGQAFTSQAYAELTEVVADLPAELMEAAPRQLARTRPRVSMSTAISAAAFAMLAALTGLLAAIVTRSMIGLVSATVGIGLVGALAFGATMAAAWHGRAR